MLPVLVCVAPDIAKERRVQRVAQARLTPTPGGQSLWATTEVLLNEHGPLASIWLQGLLTVACNREPCYTGANKDRCSSQEDLCASAELFSL